MMRLVKKKEFIKLIQDSRSETIKIENTHIHLDEILAIDMEWQSLYFDKCIFTGQRIDFCILKTKENPYQSIHFIDCTISNDLFIKNCKFHTVEFRDVEITSRHFHITTSEIESIAITGSSNKPNQINSLVLNN